MSLQFDHVVYCLNGKILNPETRRCVKPDGRIGQKILKDKTAVNPWLNNHALWDRKRLSDKTGLPLKTAKRRKAPSDRAKNYKRDKRVGQNGRTMYVSKPDKRGVYRWVKFKNK